MTPVRGIERPALDAMLWRYMDFAKFVSLLDTGALFFARADRFEDTFEFSYPIANDEAFRGTALEVNNAFFRQMLRTFAPTMFVSCWQANGHESTALWVEYLKGQPGVAVRTSFRRLYEALAAAPHADSLEVGLVRYVDYETERITDSRLHSFIYHKRIQYAHEREFRAVYWLPDIEGDPLVIDPTTARLPATPRPGLSVAVNLGQLVEAIVVAPTAPPWFGDLVRSVTKKYGLDVPVTVSALAGSPLR